MFTSVYVQDGYSKISATFSDFRNSVDFISYLDLAQLRLSGEEYLAKVEVDRIENKMY
jgi:hypothetical protein